MLVLLLHPRRGALFMSCGCTTILTDLLISKPLRATLVRATHCDGTSVFDLYMRYVGTRVHSTPLLVVELRVMGTGSQLAMPFSTAAIQLASACLS